MNADVKNETRSKTYNGLTTLIPGLPATHYYDPAQYELELARIWYRNWNYVGRAESFDGPRAYRTVEIGTQRVIVVRDDQGQLRAFHNTCRHRGAALCTEAAGRLASAHLVCPYHSWSYSLSGELLRTTSKHLPEEFNRKDFSLYAVALREWNGFVFISLAASPPPFESGFDAPLTRLDSWPMARLRTAHTFSKVMNCNWKVFWENYNECLHCPTVHPSLSRLVPIFARALMEEQDDPDWQAHASSGDPQYADPRYKGGLRAGAVTWSRDGQSTVPGFADLPEADRKAGHVYVTILPTMFVVAHVDYVRTVQLRPLGPERTELAVEFLVAPETLTNPDFDLAAIVDFTGEVMLEDAMVAELNQQGLHALAHQRGVLMPEEYALRNFHQWVAAELARP